MYNEVSSSADGGSTLRREACRLPAVRLLSPHVAKGHRRADGGKGAKQKRDGKGDVVLVARLGKSEHAVLGSRLGLGAGGLIVRRTLDNLGVGIRPAL